MNSRPILFSGPMVRALIDGSKTQTRRVVKPQPSFDMNSADECICGKSSTQIAWDQMIDSCPYGQPGDRLWVKETHRAVFSKALDEPHLQYRADGDFREPKNDIEHNQFAGILDDPFGPIIEDSKRKWRPSIFTHRWASRITLEITGIRVERLNDISEADAKAEGVIWKNYVYAAEAYAELWDAINGPGSWALNPWVWVVEFRKVEA